MESMGSVIRVSVPALRLLLCFVSTIPLHTQVFNPEEQRNIVESNWFTHFRGLNRRGNLEGKGRGTIQFSCCYNYAVVRLEVIGKKPKNATFISGNEAIKISKEIQKRGEEKNSEKHFMQ